MEEIIHNVRSEFAETTLIADLLVIRNILGFLIVFVNIFGLKNLHF